MKTNIFYVYLHKHRHDGSVFYVGKGKNKRAWDTKCRGSEWKFVSHNGCHDVEIYSDNMPEWCALTLERILIKKYGVKNLVNKNEGGQGTMSCLVTSATRGRMRDAKLGVKRPQQACDNISKGLKGIPKIRRDFYSLSEAMISWNERKGKTVMGAGNPAYDHKLYNFKNENGTSFTGTMYDFRKKFNMERKAVYRLKTGIQNKLKGWELV